MWTFVLTNDALYKFLPDTPLDRPRKRKGEHLSSHVIFSISDLTFTVASSSSSPLPLPQPHLFSPDLLDFHSIEQDEHNPNIFFTFIYKSKTKLGLSKVKGAMGLGMSFDSFLQRREYECPSAFQCFQWVTLLSRNIQTKWQKHLESLFVPEPEVYQRHAFVIKSRKGRTQDRMLLLSTSWIYNVEVTHNPTLVKKKDMKWSLPVQTLRTVTLVDDDQLILNFDKSVYKKLIDNHHIGSKGTGSVWVWMWVREEGMERGEESGWR